MLAKKNKYFKKIVSLQKRIVRYVCGVLALTRTNQLFLKTGLLKLNDVFKLQVCILMQNSMTGFDVKNKSFTFASSLYSKNTSFFRKLSFITERRGTRLGPNSFRYLGPRFWSSVKKNKIR